ncbi:MAG: hypothetical protein SPK50_06145 [Mobiluncus porci]|uniref:Uncharacterized protein n=1 Tax=Mobiluncus porci TaxID=2652278 RepID=A0A7K0K4N7_9ACTO|nr:MULTISPECIES: hypothetical protein [Mobiluncus]MCI6584425.1 hypothetical protein [Mobiluncus sp.]MDD7541845.1 hypothetical protein [Mobiluncus porci]MDY5748693.1 hypothetical protein [Mobiluncus porci]MST50442.1 hypothetical protein [Mobiluncus porci]
MHQSVKAATATLLISAGVAAFSYLAIPPFKESVDEFIKKFRADMGEREDELIEALSSTEEEVQAARETWDGRKSYKGRHLDDSSLDDDDLMFE